MAALARAASLALCAVTLVGSAAPAVYDVVLTAEAEDGGLQAIHLAGDPDASGEVLLTVDRDSRRICYDFKVARLATPLMAHIHKGSLSQSGPTVVTLFTGPGKMHDCLTWTQKWVDQIVANPAGFYVNLYTTEFPEGALRGQLSA